MAGDHEEATDGQVVVGDVRQPEGFCLRVEATKEGEDGGAGTFGTTEDLIQRIGVFGVHTPVAGEEGLSLIHI